MLFKKIVMKIFYKFFKQNIKRLLLVVGIIFFNTSLAIRLMQKGFSQKSILELQKQHTQAQIFLAKNLLNSCDLFKDKTILDRIHQEFKSHGRDFYLIKKPSISIDSLIFHRLFFKTYDLKDNNIKYLSYGYFVQDENTGKCFGLI